MAAIGAGGGRFYILPDGRARLLVIAGGLLLPLVAASFVYGSFLTHWFVTDDFVWLRSGSARDLCHFARGAFEFPRGPTPYWRPLIDFYFFGMYRVFHLHATAYLVANLLMHGTIAALLVILVRQISRAWIPAFVAGLLFAVTPAYGTTVVWASAATELIATLFALAALTLFLNGLAGDRYGAHGAAAAACFAAALLAKESAVVVPAITVVLGLAVRPPHMRRDRRRFARLVTPLVIIGGLYAAVQLSEVYFASTTTNYHIDWHAIPRLVERLRWLTLPLVRSEGRWVEGAQWAAATAALAFAGWELRRGRWAAPALFAATLVALLPTSFLTTTFAPRWVYLAATFWSGFLAVVLIGAVERVSARPLVGLTALGSVLVVLGVVFVPKTVDSQRWLSGQSEQMREIRRVVAAGCPTGSDSRIVIFPLPATDPGYVVPSLLWLYFAEVTPVRARPALPPLSSQDCALDWDGAAYRATPGDRYTEHAWVFQPAAACPESIRWDQARDSIGKPATITGPLVNARTNPGRDLTILDVGKEGGFVIILTGEDGALSQAIFDQAKRGSTICISGTVRGMRGLPTITTDDPGDVRFEHPPAPRINEEL